MHQDKTIIAIDAMTAEKGPSVVAEAAADYASRNPQVCLRLVGTYDPATFRDHDNIEVVRAEQAITKEDKMMEGLRKRDSSTHKTFALVKAEEADVGISFGRTEFIMALARKLNRIEGVCKTPLAVYLPSLATDSGYTLVLDVGAQVNCTPKDLAQFAIMGSYYTERNIERPKVGLLNIGTEEFKGSSTVNEAHEILKKYSQIDSHLNYIGYVEGWNIYTPKGDLRPDVVVCDGVRGNDIIKTSRGLSDLFTTMLKASFHRNIVTKAGGMLWQMGKGRQYLEDLVKPDNYGGAYILGLERPFIKGHGSSGKDAIMSALDIAYEYVSSECDGLIRQKIELLSSICPDEHSHLQGI